MRIDARIAGAVVLIGAISACGMLTSADVFAKPFDVAYAELAATPVPPMVKSMFPDTIARVVHNSASIEWHFANDQGDLVVFSALLSSEDQQHTRITVDARPGTALDRQTNRLLATPFMVNTARLGMAEQVAAELEDRPFNKLRFGHMLSDYFATHPAELQNYGETLHQIMAEIGGQATGMSGPHWPNQRQSAWGDKFDRAGHRMDEERAASVEMPTTPQDATHPTTDLSKFN